MSRHTSSMLDSSSRGGSSAMTWLYAILALFVFGAGAKLYRQLSKASQQRLWELEQRRRHGISDDDMRPFKIAHRDAAVRARREAERAEAEAKAERERERVRREEQRKTEVEREWLKETADERGEQPGMRRRAAQVSVGPSRRSESYSQPQQTYAPRANSPQLPGAMPANDVEPSQQSEAQVGFQPEMREIRPARGSRKRAAADENEDEATGPSRRRRIEQPQRGTKRTAESDDEEGEASIAHRAKIRAGKQRQISPVDDDMEQGSDAGGSDKENQPAREDDETMDSEPEPESGDDDMIAGEDEPNASQTPRRSPQDKSKKRLIEEVDAESTVGSSGGRPRADRKRRKNKDERLPEAEEFDASDEEKPLRRKTSKRQPRTTARPTRRVPPPPQAAGLQRRESQIVRKPGDEWTDKAGLKWRWGEDGHKRRSVAVKEIRKRYDMPKDSKHPDANVTMQVLVEKWLTEAEYEQARTERKLAWQLDEEEEMPTTPSTAPETSRKKSLYHLKGSVNPIRASTSMASLVGRAARNVTPLRRSYMTSGSLAGLTDSTSSNPASPADSRARLGASNRLGASVAKKPLTEEERKKREAELVRKLTQPEKAATPLAAAPAALPTTQAVASTSSAGASAPTFSFGTSPAPAPSGSAATEKLAEAPKAPFSFGSTPATKEPGTAAPPAAAPATFSFGAGKIETAETKPSAPFSFGGSASAPAAPPATASPAAAPAAPPSFSFGAAPAKPAAAAPTPGAVTNSPPSFSFGTSSSTPAAQPAAASASSFSFGAKSAAAPTSSTPAAAPGVFSFGSSSPAQTPAAGFSFGASTSTPAATPAAAHTGPATFSFGAGSTPAPAAATPAPGATFSFGSSASPAPVPNAASASAPSFSFGAGGSAAPAAGSFSFGSGGGATKPFTFGKK